MAAWALTEYKFRGSTALALFLSIGIMVPIRLGSVAILTMMREAGLNDTLTALILVYIAQGLPLSIFILSEFIQQIPRDLRDAARCDGVPETRIFFEVIAPLLRPAIATVAVFTIVPIWNDLWFPLILTSSDSTHTITLGVQQFLGQYITDWNSVLAALSMAILPVVAIYVDFLAAADQRPHRRRGQIGAPHGRTRHQGDQQELRLRACAERHQSRDRERRIRRPGRPLGLRQIHASEDDRRTRRPDLRATFASAANSSMRWRPPNAKSRWCSSPTRSIRTWTCART